jgi:sugar transferase (PEP-CTERM/EpsH1 system associated)
MRIILIAHSFPYPLHEGVRMHVYHLLKELSKKNEMHLACFIESEEENAYQVHLKPFCRSITTVLHKVPKCPLRRLQNMLFGSRPFSVEQFASKDMERALIRLRDEIHPEIIHLDFTVMAQYGELFPETAKVFFPHDAMSMLFERNVARERNLLFRLYTSSQSSKMRQYEAEILPRFERTVVVSPVDQGVLQRRAPSAVVLSCPNGVDTEYFVPGQGPEKPGRIIFRGLMNFLPNADAAIFFARDVMPLIWQRKPDAEFWIVGSNPIPEVESLARTKGIRVTGFVEDLREAMAESEVIVSPMRIGSGIKNKILEAMAMAKAVVATPMSLAGISGVPGEDFLTGATPQELADQTVALLEDPSRRRRVGEHARETVLRFHSWESHCGRFHQIYEEALEAHAHSHH